MNTNTVHQLTENILGIVVPSDAVDIKCKKWKNRYFHFDYGIKDGMIGFGFAFLYKDFGSKSNYPSSMNILGEVTTKEITFDVEPYVEKKKEYGKVWIYKKHETKDIQDGVCFSAKESFYSLLASKGVELTEEAKLVIIKIVK